MSARDPGARERASDRSWPRRVSDWLGDWNIHLRQNWYRDCWLLAISIVCVWAAVAANNAGTDAVSAVHAVKKGRHVAVGVTCAALSAVGRAGYDVILRSGRPVSVRQERALEAIGFPPLKVRAQAARVEASDYVRSISTAVEMQLGQSDAHLIRGDGSLRCARLERLSDAR